MDDLKRLAELIQARNAIERDAAAIIGRPMHIGHVGEYIAARVFHLRLQEAASQKAVDGYFELGTLAGRSVNVKWFTKNDGLLNLTVEASPDYYLVLTGPATAPGSSRGKVHPWCIHSVYLFDAHDLLSVLQARGVKISVATSVSKALWDAAEVFPQQHNPRLPLSAEERSLLGLFH